MVTELDNIANGRTVTVDSLKDSKLKVKLMEMGLIPGKKVKVLFRAPFGDPIAIDIEGYVLSLRKSEANLIYVNSEEAL
ncbi:MAG: FeoA family protein [Crocinitomicaceae bacterium]